MAASVRTLPKRNLMQAVIGTLRHIVRYRKLELLSVTLLLLIIGFFSVQNLLGTDESDNFLAAKLILDGHVPYRDFFSHHMPGTYIISTVLYLLSAGNVLGFRLLFVVLVAAWILWNSYLLHAKASRWSAIVYTVLAALTFGLSLHYQLLAETIIALIVTTLLIRVLMYDKSILVAGRPLWLSAVLLAAIPVLALSYVYIAALLYIPYVFKLRPDSLRQTLRLSMVALSPYLLLGVVMVATGSLRDFIFQNLTFNASYYAPFLDRPGANPVITGLDIAWNSLKQIGHVITSPWSYIGASVLLISYISLPVILWQKGQRLLPIVLLVMLLFVNSRFSLYGVPAIENFSAVTHHAGLYRTIAILMVSLSLCYLLQPMHNPSSTVRKTIKISMSGVVLLLIVLFATSLSEVQTASPLQAYRVYTSYPDKPVRIINTITDSQDTAWSGPISFLNQSYLKAKIASEYTFYMPWHHACTECRSDFFEQLKANQPVAIEWKPFEGVPTYPYPSYPADVKRFLQENYFQVETSEPGFENLHFLRSDRERIILSLRNSGYQVR